MAHAGPEDRPRPVGDLGARVEITVVPGPRGPTPRQRLAAMRYGSAIACLAAAAVAAGALVAGLSPSDRGGATRPVPRSVLPITVPPNLVLHPTYLRAIGPVDDPPTSTYPLRCLSLVIALHDPRLIEAAFDRAMRCGHPRGPYTLIAVRAMTGRTPPSARSPRR